MSSAAVEIRPYIGLRYFTEADAHLFYGRDEHVAELLAKVAENRFVAVMGSSGCGKSSLVRAGLLPELRSGMIPEAGPRWKVVQFNPGVAPLRELGNAIRSELGVEHAEALVQEGPLGVARAVAEAKLDPGINVLAAAERKPRPFDALLIDDSSRLSRDDADAPMIFKRLVDLAGIRYISVSQGIDSENEQARLLVGIHGIVDSLYVRELGKKTHRGLEGKMLRGFSAGGRCYGYRNVPTSDGVRWEVEREQATVVRRIFELAAEGRGLKDITKTLNAEGIAPPRPRAGRRPAWCHNAIRAMLRNPLYIGKVIWNRDRFIKTPAGTRVARRCSECGGPLTIVAGYHKGRNSRYGCSNHANRGEAVCKNGLREGEEQIQQRLLSKLQDAVLTEAAIEFAIEEFARQLQAQVSRVSSRLAADRERKATLEAELGRLWQVIASGGEFQSLRQQIAERDAELRGITDRLLSPGPGSLEADLGEIRKFVTKSLRDLPGILSRDVPAARAWLAQHVSKITMTPTQTAAGKRYYRASGEWDLLGGTECQIGVIAGVDLNHRPLGYEPNRSQLSSNEIKGLS